MDRFTRLSNEIQVQQTTARYNDTTASIANKRLAQELGSNPEVVAALRAKKKPVFQRLGVKNRLGISNGLYQRGYQQRNGFSPFRRGYRNGGGGQFPYYNNRGFRQPRNFGPKRMDVNYIGSLSEYAFGRGGFRNRFRGGGGAWRFGRGGGRGQGGGRGRGGGIRHDPLSREELDRQLDEYMSKTKTHLDDDLDAYMGDAAVI